MRSTFISLVIPAAAERFRGWPLAGILLRLNSLNTACRQFGCLAAWLLAAEEGQAAAGRIAYRRR
jgi:hypothetical protein